MADGLASDGAAGAADGTDEPTARGEADVLLRSSAFAADGEEEKEPTVDSVGDRPPSSVMPESEQYRS